MPFEGVPADELSRSFEKLSDSAKALNKASDQLSSPINDIDIALQNLKLGISYWVQVHEETKDGALMTRYVGYERLNNHWGICTQQTIRKNGAPVETSRWTFNDSPRWLRVRSLEKIPELLTALAKEADKQKAMLESHLKFAQTLAASVKTGAAK